MRLRLIVIFLSIILCITGCKEDKSRDDYEKYNEIEKNVKLAVEKKISATGFTGEGKVYIDTLVSSGYLNKQDILEEDNAYCSGYALMRVNDHDEYCIKVYIKCRQYTTEGYGSWNVQDACIFTTK